MKRMTSLLRAATGLALMASALTAGAQQLPIRTNWQFNYFQENPAFAGFTDCLELKAGFRQQWAGFDGAPQTAYANLQGEIGRSAGGNIHGFGGRVTDDVAGAREKAAQIFALYGTLPSYRAMLDREGWAEPGDAVIVGDEDTVRAGLARYAEAGVTDPTHYRSRG